jgi:hypothetical protein
VSDVREIVTDEDLPDRLDVVGRLRQLEHAELVDLLTEAVEIIRAVDRVRSSRMVMRGLVVVVDEYDPDTMDAQIDFRYDGSEVDTEEYLHCCFDRTNVRNFFFALHEGGAEFRMGKNVDEEVVAGALKIDL